MTIHIEPTEHHIWAAGEFSLRRAREALEAEDGDAGWMIADLRAAAENLTMAANEIERRLTGVRRG